MREAGPEPRAAAACEASMARTHHLRGGVDYPALPFFLLSFLPFFGSGVDREQGSRRRRPKGKAQPQSPLFLGRLRPSFFLPSFLPSGLPSSQVAACVTCARWPRAVPLLLVQPPMIGGRCARGADPLPHLQRGLNSGPVRWIGLRQRGGTLSTVDRKATIIEQTHGMSLFSTVILCPLLTGGLNCAPASTSRAKRRCLTI
jgi:hypothetical protein